MAIINDPNITNDLINLISGGSFDVNSLTTIINAGLPAGQQLSTGAGISTGIYKRFGQFDKVDAKVEVVTTGLWSGDSGSLTAAFTSSTQVAATSGQYYYNIYDKNPVSNTSAEVQFAVAYGHVSGSGSVTLDIDDNALLASKATYAQYKTMLLDNPTNNFTFEKSDLTTTTASDIYVINIARNRFREEMDAGNWELSLSGSNGLFNFIDDSGKKFGDTLGKAGRVFKVVEGSLNLGTQLEATVTSTYETSITNESYGSFYPDRGIIVLNPKAIGAKVGKVWDEDWTEVGDLTGSLSTATEQYNHKRLFYAIKAGGDFEARRTEDVNTQHFFVRATNREFNYSNNPTYYTSNGSFNEVSFETDPQTFITTIGLYNDANELMAVAKTSQPIVKSFDKEVLIKVKLSF